MPGSLLKGSIPIRTFSDWDDTAPGFAQVDLVGHEGGNSAGFFAQTLTLTDVATGWTEPRALPNKARRWVTEAIDEEGLADAVDELVRSGEVASRSEAVRLGLERLVDERRRAAIGRQILEGYQRVPETDEELAWARANTRRLIDEEPW
ncbi:MAG: ribbon-helix-helix domain-containing protein [Acidimicrobiales bacterium]